MVNSSSSETGGGEGDASPFPYSRRFNEVFPYYLAIGMTYDQFWNDDPGLVRAYRKAAEIKADRKNQELWLQGMYIYDALCCASPILRSFAKKGTKPVPYPTTPYALSDSQQKKEKASREKKTYEKGKARMLAYMQKVNASFEQTSKTATERGESNVGND